MASRTPLPDLDRAQWLAQADWLLRSAQRHMSEDGTSLVPPGPQGPSGRATDALEGFARTAMLLGFRVRHDGEDGIEGICSAYRSGLRTGPAPGGPWPAITDRSQSRVEAAGVAIALFFGRQSLWEPLSRRERDQLGAWLRSITGTRSWPNNHRVFSGVVHAFLAAVGVEHSHAEVTRSIEAAEELYLGCGWYTDGHSADHERLSLDYYNAWAFHFYLPILAVMTDRADLVERYAKRVADYLPELMDMLDAAGRPVYHGRSLTYRCALVAAGWAAALLGVELRPPGALRQWASSCLMAFLPGPASHPQVQPDDTPGPEEPGWLRPSRVVLQGYSGPASSYWLAKAFLGLALPAGHPAWTTASARPTPGDDRWVAAGRHALCAPKGREVVLLHTVATRHAARDEDPHYARLVYSSATAPDCVVGATDAGVGANLRGRPLVVRQRSARHLRSPDSRQLCAELTLDSHLRVPRQRLQYLMSRLGPALHVVTVVVVATGAWCCWVVEARRRTTPWPVPSGDVTVGTPAVAGGVAESWLSPGPRPDRVTLAGDAATVSAWPRGRLSVSIARSEGANAFGDSSQHIVATIPGGRGLGAIAWSLGSEQRGRPPVLAVDERRRVVRLAFPGHLPLLVDRRNGTTQITSDSFGR